MKCKNMDGLLSTYANGELSPEQRETVETHLAGCAECRKQLEKFHDVRRHMETLRGAPSAPDIKAEIMSSIKSASPDKKHFNGWRRRLMIIVPAVIVLLALLIIQPWNSPLSPQSVLAQAYARMAEIKSYRSSITSISAENRSSRFEIEFTSPDRYHLKQVSDEGSREFIIIGDEQYYRCTGVYEQGIFASFISMQALTNSYSNMITLEGTAEWLNMLKNIEELSEETIEGVTCLHYRGMYDYEKMFRTQQEENAERGIPPLSRGEFEARLAQYRTNSGERGIELWIGKEDYLLRQIKITIQRPGESQPRISTQKFYDFNQQVNIEAPVDKVSKLLPGWLTTTPEQPNFSKEIREVSIDTEAPENREINYTVILTNISKETLTEFNVQISPGLTDGTVGVRDSVTTLTKDLVSTEGIGPASLTLQPGAAQQHDITFRYDASSIEPGRIVDAIENAGFFIGYRTPDGQQKIEVFHLEVPDSIYTLPVETAPSLELVPAGEYRVDEPGASSAGHGVTGEINGLQYLFIKVNTQNSNAAAPPGILVLNVENPAEPVKVSYLQAPEDTKYMMNSALSGTILYVSTGDYLWIIDVSNPDSPKELARFSEVHATTLAAAGKYLYVNDANQRITALDVADPSHPRVLGSIDMPSLSGMTLQIFGNYLLVWQRDTLHTINISSPAYLKILNSYTFTFPGGSPAHVHRRTSEGDYAYIAVTGDEGNGMLVLDISNPAEPHEIACLDLKEQYIMGDILVTENRVYFPTVDVPDRTKLVAVNILDPANPKELTSGTMPDYWKFFDDASANSSHSYDLVDNYLYWYIGNPPNKPLIEIFNLSTLE